MSSARIDELKARAQYARERYQLYKAKSYGQQPTSPVRLRELKRLYEQAEASLRFARAEEKRSQDSGEGHLT